MLSYPLTCGVYSNLYIYGNLGSLVYICHIDVHRYIDRGLELSKNEQFEQYVCIVCINFICMTW